MSEAVEHRHHLELFLGNTHTEHDEDAFSIGLGYEYRLNHFLGIGVLGEYAVKDIDAWVVGVPIAIHPGAGWRLVVMPGLELHDGDSEFLFRTGVGYEFELDRYTIMPEFNADFVDDEVNYVFGVGMGVQFQAVPSGLYLMTPLAAQAFRAQLAETIRRLQKQGLIAAVMQPKCGGTATSYLAFAAQALSRRSRGGPSDLRGRNRSPQSMQGFFGNLLHDADGAGDALDGAR